MTDRTLTSNPNNENLVAELEAAAAKWVLEKSKYTLECLRDARRAVLKQMQPTGNETFDDAAELAFYRASIPESLRWDRVDPNVKDAWRKHTQKASEPRELTLHDFGYAPGNYSIKCLDCGQEALWCDKRAARCKTCAEQAMRKNRTNAVSEGDDRG